MFNLNRKRVIRNQKLGAGTFGEVYPYQKDPDDNRWVVKNALTRDIDKVLIYFQEIVLGFRCQNTYILPVRGYFIDYDKVRDDWDIYIKLPRMKSSLRAVLVEHKNKPIPEIKIAQYLYELAQGLLYLHEQGIAHRDIKPDNILIDDKGQTKIADFGLGNFYGDATNTHMAVAQAGSIFYTAPENKDCKVKLDKKDLFMTDLWSLGMVAFELCTRLELRHLDLFASGEVVSTNLSKKLQECEGEYSKTLINLILSLLRSNPSERKSLHDLNKELITIYGSQLQKETSGKADKDVTEMQEEMKAKDAHFEATKEMESFYKDLIGQYQLKTTKFEKVLAAKSIDIVGMENRLKELEKKLEVKNAHIQKLESSRQQMQQEYQLKIDELGTRLKELEKELEARNSNIKELEETIQDMSPSQMTISNGPKLEKVNKQSNINIQAWTKDLKKKWEKLFDFKNEIEKGLTVKMKDCLNMRQDTIKRFMNELTQIHQNNDYESVQHLKMDLAGWWSASVDDAVREFSDQIGSKMQDLIGLNLNVPTNYGAGYVTDKTVNFLITQLSDNFQSFQQLSLNFWDQNKITDEAIKELAAKLSGKSKNLNHLALNFGWCYEITDQGLTTLASSIASNLKQLQHLELNFYFCYEITNEGVKKVASYIQDLKNLQYLKLDFGRIELSQQTKEFVNTCFKSVPTKEFKLGDY